MTTEPLPTDSPSDTPVKPEGNGWRTFGIVVITVLITLGLGYWAVTSWLFPSEFKPVILNSQQQQSLDRKVQQLGIDTASQSQQPLQPERYSEAGASREIEFSERELNALLARNTDLASKLAIDLSDNLISAKLLVNIDPDFPVFGGKTLKVTGGMELRLGSGRPSAILKGISVWGVPLPNAWLGNLKDIDLLQEFGQSGGFWQIINDGVEQVEVNDGRLLIRLKE
jgi:hypothetical protein